MDCHYAIVTIDRQLFAIAAHSICEMLVMPEVAGMPAAPPDVRGVASLRGRVMPILDTRIRMGRRAARQDIDSFCALMQQREQDHVSWLEELYSCVLQGRDFKLTLDPHQCAFGKWYDSFESKDTLISALLRRFDAPHKRIHMVGESVRKLLTSNNTEAAKSLIDSERMTTLCEMRALFSSLRTLIAEHQREMAIVITAGAKVFGAAVDGLESVELLPAADIRPLPPGLEHGGLVTGVARRKATDELVLILDAERLCQWGRTGQVAACLANPFTELERRIRPG